jgi:hypothetical protein
MAWRFTAVALTSPADLPKCSVEHLPYRDWTFDGEELKFVVPSGTENGYGLGCLSLNPSSVGVKYTGRAYGAMRIRETRGAINISLPWSEDKP